MLQPCPNATYIAGLRVRIRILPGYVKLYKQVQSFLKMSFFQIFRYRYLYFTICSGKKSIYKYPKKSDWYEKMYMLELILDECQQNPDPGFFLILIFKIRNPAKLGQIRNPGNYDNFGSMFSNLQCHSRIRQQTQV